ncbi:hypothetical protein HNR37_000932 [Desulfurispira natronophila]|uniref:Uncharacterized protein n=1 Tax=Desulfurispira natronophila TaxID=682562 RepID=A0A7W7Y3X5_9BACT|nr:hypothetical protein [Desulfurispira natronophila]
MKYAFVVLLLAIWALYPTRYPFRWVIRALIVGLIFLSIMTSIKP